MPDVKGPTPPPRLTRAESQARTRAALIDAAAATFAERGFHGTTVGHIVTRAGYTRGAFYSNFTDLDDLFLAVFDDRLAADRAEITPLVTSASSMEELVEMIRSPRTRSGTGTTWRLLLAEFRLHALRDPSLRPKLAEREQMIRDSFKTAIEHVFHFVEVTPPADTAFLGLLVQALVDGIGQQHDVDPDGVPRDAFLDAIALLFDAGVALSQARGEGSSAP